MISSEMMRDVLLASRGFGFARVRSLRVLRKVLELVYVQYKQDERREGRRNPSGATVESAEEFARGTSISSSVRMSDATAFLCRGRLLVHGFLVRKNGSLGSPFLPSCPLPPRDRAPGQNREREFCSPGA